jgi:hypothetical protein
LWVLFCCQEVEEEEEEEEEKRFGDCVLCFGFYTVSSFVNLSIGCVFLSFCGGFAVRGFVFLLFVVVVVVVVVRRNWLQCRLGNRTITWLLKSSRRRKRRRKKKTRSEILMRKMVMEDHLQWVQLLTGPRVTSTIPIPSDILPSSQAMHSFIPLCLNSSLNSVLDSWVAADSTEEPKKTRNIFCSSPLARSIFHAT